MNAQVWFTFGMPKNMTAIKRGARKGGRVKTACPTCRAMVRPCNRKRHVAMHKKEQS